MLPLSMVPNRVRRRARSLDTFEPQPLHLPLSIPVDGNKQPAREEVAQRQDEPAPERGERGTYVFEIDIS